jgi:very-short-patch-repair endonuclease
MDYKWQNISVDRVGILKDFARKNRREMTDAEKWMWEHLRTIPDVRFRRQHPIGDYIVDFVCLKFNLIIEVDGAYHNEPQQQAEDAIRSDYLRDHGFIILRFTNEEVLYDTESVIQTINKQIQQRKLLYL